MAITIPGSVTGSAQTGFTSPTYTTALDTPPDTNAKQSVVTAIGGTQVGVDVHSVSRPFTISAWKPKVFGVLGKANPITGVIANVPRNNYKIITRKGVTPLAGQPAQVAILTTEISIPAGADVADSANIRAAISAHLGTLASTSAGIGDTAANGVL